MPVPSRTRLVCAARNASRVNGSIGSLEGSNGNWPFTVYGYFDWNSGNMTTCSGAQIEWNPRSSTARAARARKAGSAASPPR